MRRRLVAPHAGAHIHSRTWEAARVLLLDREIASGGPDACPMPLDLDREVTRRAQAALRARRRLVRVVADSTADSARKLEWYLREVTS